MKEHGILFRADMVRAILEGRKTQTRRLVRLRPDKKHPEWPWQPLDMLPMKDGSGNYVTLMQRNPELGSVCGYPMGKGDRLWVKETYRPCVCEKCLITPIHEPEYRADGDDPHGWKSSMFMPRKASRIDLEILSVRAERLQDITYQDAIAEGIPHTFPQVNIDRYAKLWDEINKKPGRTWLDNPFVWVITFKRISP